MTWPFDPETTQHIGLAIAALLVAIAAKIDVGSARAYVRRKRARRTNDGP